MLKLLRNVNNRIFHSADLKMKSTEARPVILAFFFHNQSPWNISLLRFPFQVCGLLVSTSFLLFEKSVDKSLSQVLSLASLKYRADSI